MSKFSCEIDTEAKTAIFMIDGKETDFSEFTLSKYSYSGSCCDNCLKTSTSVSYSNIDQSNGERTSKSIYFDDKSISESSSNYSVAKEVYKSVVKLQATDTLNKVLAKYKINS